MPVLTLLLACIPEATQQPPEPELGSGLFAEGCPTAGHALARQIGVDATLRGQRPVGSRGDFLLMNEHAAFVVTAPGTEKTYWYYGGALADAASMDGCTQVSDDELDDIGLVLGDLDLGDRTKSTLRGFRAETAEIVADGSDGGEAVLRVTGVDDMHWLVDHELQYEDMDREFARPLGVTMTVDYVLAPDRPVLEIAVSVEGSDQTPPGLLGAALVTFGDTLDVRGYASDRLEFVGLNLGTAMPWIVASDGTGAYALAVDGLNLGFMNIAGVDIAVDVDQVAVAPVVPGENGRYGYFFAVGATDANSATRALHAVKDTPTRAGPYALVPVDGTVSDASGTVSGATVEVLARAPGAEWGVLDAATTDSEGKFSLEVPSFDDPWELATRVTAPGRDPSADVPFDPVTERTLTLTAPPVGALSFTIRDGSGAPSPARIELHRDDGYQTWEPVYDSGEIPVRPGDYDVVVHRGYEFAPVRATVTVPAGGSADLDAVLERIVDTTGFVSTDTHIHSDPSPDSRVLMARQLAVAAANGLEIPVSTDHEIIVGFADVLATLPISAVLGTISGEEMTAAAPEHMTVLPVEPDGTPRGGAVRWFGMDYPEVLAANRERGALVSLLNHPGYLDRIGWDRVQGAPTLLDPTRLGMRADAELWGWDFDGVELMNGMTSPFMDGNHRFENWQSLINHGHPMTGVAASDDHGGYETGYPRSYVALSTDDPTAFDIDEYVDSMLAGRVTMSAGAFARINVGDATMGDLVTGSEIDLGILVQALPEVDVSEVVVYANCDVLAQIPAEHPGEVVKLDTELRVVLEADTNLVVAAFSDVPMPSFLHSVGSTVPRAITNPIYVDVDGNGAFDAPGGKECDTARE